MSISATRMQDWRIRSRELYKNQFAAKEYGAMDFYLQQTALPNSVASLELRERSVGSMGNTIKVPVLQSNTTATVSTSRNCTVTNNETSSALATLSWATIQDGFTMYPNRYMNNDIKYAEHFAANMDDMLKRLYTKVDQLCVANLSSYKTSLFGETLNYSQNSNIINAKWQDRFDLIGDLTVLQRGNNFRGRMNVIGNYGVLNLFNKLAEHDTFNDVNKRYEYADKNLWLTGNIANADSKYATMYCVPDGQVAVLSRVSRAEFNNSKSGGHEWSTVRLPMMENIEWGLHYYETQGDMSVGSGESDMTCDYSENYAFAIDLAFVNAYNPDTTAFPQPIMEADIATGDNGTYDVNVLTMPS